MDPNSTGRARPPFEEPLRPPSKPRWEPTAGFAPGRRGAVAIAALAIVALIAGIAVVGGHVFGTATTSAAPDGTPWAATSETASARLVATATSAPTASPTPLPTPTPAPTAPPLPALLGAIGDSYSQAYSVSPDYVYDHTQFSWVIGTDKNDGVFSLLERFRALGGSPSVVDAATSGKKMVDAQRQANLVVAAAKKLAPGKTAYVTFELGTNDLCASPDFMTDPADFEARLKTAIATLRAGLPAGSRILMLSVPDFPHFHDITEADAGAKANLSLPQNSNRCAPYLGTSSPSAVAQANDYLSRYDASLKQACDDINADEGTTGRLHCTYNASLLADSDFTIEDLSTADYFHPSLSGQAKMAADAWQADVWSSMSG